MQLTVLTIFLRHYVCVLQKMQGSNALYIIPNIFVPQRMVCNGTDVMDSC